MGLDAYPGTFSLPLPPEETGRALVGAATRLRRDLMPRAGLGARVYINITENGWPTGPGRSLEAQVTAMRSMITAIDAARTTLGIAGYDWFGLRDSDSSSTDFQRHFGILLDTPKPAFAVYRELIAQLGEEEDDRS